MQLGHKTSQYIINQNSIIDIQNELRNQDFIFIALHGSFGEDGAIQSILSEMNIPFNGSNEKSSKICFDKAETKKIVIGEGIDSPKYYHTSSNSCNDHFDFSAEKYVVKPNAQGSSVGFNIVNDISKINLFIVFQTTFHLATDKQYQTQLFYSHHQYRLTAIDLIYQSLRHNLYIL